MNIRIKFQKYGVMKFIGHLDIMRYFQKAIRRADIDIAYSEGYSPHQIMSFAAPLGVGVTSDGEYFDIEVNSTLSSKASIDALNQVMVDGISILEYKKLPDTAKTSMSLVAAADYLVYVKPGYEADMQWSFEELQEKLQEFFEGQKAILITKQTKKQEIEMDLKPLIYELKAVNLKDEAALRELHVKNPEIMKDWKAEKDCAASPAQKTEASMEKKYAAFFLKVCTGSSDNIKPELVLEAFYKFCNAEYHPLAFQIHRLEVYAKADEIPVKGEKEREEYQNYLNRLKQKMKIEGKEFPAFFTLGELGEDLL